MPEENDRNPKVVDSEPKKVAAEVGLKEKFSVHCVPLRQFVCWATEKEGDVGARLVHGEGSAMSKGDSKAVRVIEMGVEVVPTITFPKERKLEPLNCTVVAWDGVANKATTSDNDTADTMLRVFRKARMISSFADPSRGRDCKLPRDLWGTGYKLPFAARLKAMATLL